MPHVSELLQSKYLKKEDLQRPVLWAVAAIRKEPVKDPKTGDSEEKWIIYFEEDDRGLVLNKTNIHKLGELCGDDTDSWIGHKVVLYNDPTVSFGGKSGGIRIRAPKVTVPPPKPAPVQSENPAAFDDDIPY